VASGGDIGGDRREVQVHHRGVAPGQYQTHRLALFGTDGAENVGGSSSLIRGCRRAATALGPAPGDLVLLTDPGLVAEPDF